MWSDLSTRHLLALRAVAEEGTFGRAASRLGFTQSAVSQQVAALEQLVGQPLFDRPAGPRPPRLTPAGTLLLSHANGFIEGLETAERDLDRFARGVSGNLAIGTFQSISARVLPETLRQLHEEAPGVEVTLIDQEYEQDFRFGALASGEIDLAFAAGEVDPAFGCQYLGADPHIAVVQPGFPAGPVDLLTLSGQPMIGQPEDDPCGLGIDRGLERLGVTPNYVFRSHDNGAVQGMVGARVGIAIVSLLAVDTSDPTISVRTTEPELEPRQLSIIWDGERTLAPVAQRFIDIVAEVCTKQLASI
ncbi:MAG: LysR family transcriptional regulator [Actinomycetia bacterium]|nr:LysR family transcriptional regulator [Actinomycetes bacterium]MCP4225274.1 LysR family transcriptional regulator [Actinomycetes bacterium]MCP5031397.1 LysR family transcriptional regulator [Actinomycetes bacterium]